MSKKDRDGEWLHHAQSIREEERAKVAREIHDELGQLLMAIRVETFLLSNSVRTEDPAVKEQLSRMVTLVSEASRAMERLASELRSGILTRLGLVAAIDWQSKELEKRAGIKSHVVFNGNVNLESDRSLNIFRVYQEALTNVARHSGATRVDSRLEVTGSNLSLVINDNGHGFDLNKVKMDNALGLTGMKERAVMLGGTLSIESESRNGTTIRLVIPVVLKNS